MNSPLKAPPQRNLPIIEHAVQLYKQWYIYKNDLPLAVRRTLGDKIDTTFLQILESLFIASYQSREKKIPTLIYALQKVDILKFFLRITWEIRAFDSKRYATISENLDELGRMLGGWKRGLETKTLPL
ncbi:MAG: four helix bundle protein [Parcubacteria group bacterium]